MGESVVREIPGTLGFKVSDDGIVYDPDGVVRNQYVNGDWYRTASVKLLDGRWQTFGVHRLVALAHLPCDKDVSQLTVNHIDHDVTNNDVDNLEWVSVYLNNLHASLMQTQVDSPRLVWTDHEGKQCFVDNLYAASAAMNLDLDLAWSMVRDGLVINQFKLEAFNRHTPVPEQLRRPNFYTRDAYGRSIQTKIFVKCLETGRVERFESIADAALRYETSPSHVFQCISTEGKTRLFKRRYLVVRGLEKFPDVSYEEWQKLRGSGGKTALAFNKVTGEKWVFPAAAEMIKLLKLSKKAVTTRLRRDGVCDVGGYIMAYATHKEQFEDRVANSSSS